MRGFSRYDSLLSVVTRPRLADLPVFVLHPIQERVERHQKKFAFGKPYSYTHFPNRFSELAVAVFLVLRGRDFFDDIPMFGNFAVFDAVEIIKSGVFALELAFAEHQNKIALA